ncbi:MAG: iron ABC transporter permease [Lentisphaerae bacterium]|nr:iron ABC transporter permease [Lentisphaerota bacterium]
MIKNRKIWLFLAVFVLFAVILPFIGAEKLDWRAIFARGGAGGPYARIFFQLRLPRVWLGLLAGGALAMAGAALQVTFRNPLAEPWTLGMAGGAGLGAFVARMCPGLWVEAGIVNTAQLLALIGAGGALALVLAVARRQGGGTTTMLLAGVTVGVISGGAIMAASGLVSPDKLAGFHRWLLGGLDAADWRAVGALALVAGPGVGVLAALAREYNPLGLGEAMAAGQGVEVARVRQWTAVGAGLAAAGVAAVAGPIGFVGLLAPHAVRRVLGADMRVVLPVSFLAGGCILAGCDALGRWAAAPVEVPVGALMALAGGPVFLWLLARRR